MDCIAPDLILDGVKDKGTTNGSVTASWKDEGVVSATYSYNGGEQKEFSSGDAFDKEGTYVLTLKDDLGNTTTKAFTIDKTVDYVVRTSDGKTIQGDATTSDDVIIEAYKDGQKIEYELGQELKDYGHYEVVVKDKLGNARTYSFTLKFQMNAWAITLIALGLTSVAAVITTIVIRRKRTFKK